MIFPLLVISLYGTMAQPLNEGDSCRLQNGNSGFCHSVRKCESVAKQLLAGYLPTTLCGYSNYEPIVCCPSEGLVPPPSPHTENPRVDEDDGRGAISRQKCAEYSQYGYTVVYPPVGLRRPVNISQCAIKSQKLIVGGTKAERMEFPHMAAIGYNLSGGSVGWRCGGSIISERFILTAAHCTYTDELGDAAWVRVGDLNLVRSDDGANPVDIPVADRIRHPEYNPTVQYHDIALLHLETEINFNGWTKPACLHTAPTTGTQNAIAAGWGRVDWIEDEASNDLLKVVLPLVNSQDCDAKFKNVRTLPDGINGESMICAGIKGKDTCQGDSGGPLAIFNKKEYCMYDIVGITSFGTGCGHTTPGVYTRVYHYVPWIESTVWGRG